MAAKSVNLENDGHEKEQIYEEQIIRFIKQAETGLPIKDLCRKGGFSDATFYRWRARYGGMDVPDERRPRGLEARSAITLWRLDCNEIRPHGGCGRMPPAEFAELHRQRAGDATRTSSTTIGIN